MAEAAIPLVVAGIGAGVAIYSQKKQSDDAAAARKAIPKPPVAPIQPDQASLDQQAARRRRFAAGANPTMLTGPQGIAPPVGLSATLGT